MIGAPANGVGVVGIYPQAVLRSWDAALGSGTRLDSGQIAAGILAAARAGRGVINLSVGGSRDLAVELAVKQAVALGSLVVAASGNSGEEGSPIGYPAALAHVTTVAATDSSGVVASFFEPVELRRPCGPGRRDPRRERDRRELAARGRHELLVADRRRRGGLDLDRASRADGVAGRRGPPQVGA